MNKIIKFKILIIYLICLTFIIVSCDRTSTTKAKKEEEKKSEKVQKEKLSKTSKKEQKKEKIKEKIKKVKKESLKVEKTPKKEEKPKKEKKKEEKLPKKTEKIVKKEKFVQLQIKINDVLNNEVIPDKIVIKDNHNKIIKDLKKIKPGKYLLEIEKNGFKSLKKEINIPENIDKITLKEVLNYSPRTLYININEFPDEILIGKHEKDLAKVNYKKEKEKVKIDKELLPGDYIICIKRKGRKEIKKNIRITPESKPLILNFKFNPNLVKVKINVSYATLPKSMDHKIKFIKDGKEVKLKDNCIEPGKYILEVSQEGFETVKKEITIEPQQGTFIEQVNLKPKKRAIKIEVLNEKNKIMKPDKILIDNKEIKNNEKIEPGFHTLKVIKKNYEIYEEKVYIPTGKDVFKISNIVLTALPREIYLSFKDSKTKKEIKPQVWINDIEYREGMKLKPGTYKIRIELKNYKSVKENITIPEGEKPYKKEFLLNLIKDKSPVYISVYTKYSEVGEKELKPDKILIDGLQYKPGIELKFGKHDVLVELKNYKRLIKEINVPKGKEKVEIKLYLEPNPVKIDFKITVDYPAGTFIKPDKILIDGKPYKGEVMPGTREIEIYKDGYEPIKEHFLVKSSTTPLTFFRFMKVLPREINIICKDKKTKKEVKEIEILINNKKVNKENLKFKPGKYNLVIKSKGYKEFQKEIDLKPSSKPLKVEILLEKIEKKEVKKEAKKEKNIRKRAVVIDSIDTQNNLRVEPLKVIINGKELKPTDLFKVGERLHIKVLYKRYETYETDIIIDDDKGNFVIPIILKPLKRYVFKTIRNSMVLDNIRYNYTFWINEKPVEKHLITQKKEKNIYIYEIYLPPKLDKIIVKCGYLRADIMLLSTKTHIKIGRLNLIDVKNFKEHFNKIAKKLGREKTFKKMERIIKRKVDILNQYLSDEEKEELLQYLSEFDINNKHQDFINHLEERFSE